MMCVPIMYPITLFSFPRNSSTFLVPYNKVSSTLNWTGFLSVFSRHDDDLVVVSEELFVIF